MDKNNNEMPKIKLGNLDFNSENDNNFTTNYDSFNFDAEKNVQVDNHEVAENYYTENKSKKNNFEENILQVNIEKPDENKVRKFTLFASIVFFIVIMPICYHNLKDYIEMTKAMPNKDNLEVSVEQFQKQDIYNSTEATGLIVPESSVDVVARVDGYLQDTYFREGDFVKKGQLLFKIEPNSYLIAVRAAKASVEQSNAVYQNSLQELERAKELIKENFISRSDYDSIVATANQNKAALDEVKESLARAQLDLNYTNIYSPLDGKAGKIQLSNGNYVGLSSGSLVNIAKTNPICVSFSMKSADVIRLKQSNGGVLDLSNAKVEIILSNDEKYSETGKINFSDNNVAEDAATLSLKAVFENKDNILIPGDYVKVVITPATPTRNYLIPQAITRGDALNGYYVWGINNGVTKKMPLTVIGSRENNWIVSSGINEDDLIIVKENISIDLEGTPAKIKVTEKSKKGKNNEFE